MRTVLKSQPCAPPLRASAITVPSDGSPTAECSHVTPQRSHIEVIACGATPQLQIVCNNQQENTPLWGVWEMWCDFPTKQQSNGKQHQSMTQKLSQYQPPTWLDSVKSIGLFDTVEGFWGIHDCTLPPSRLPNGSNYYLFRNNVAPMWEQEANRRGGKWVGQVSGGTLADEWWTELCVAAIAEQFPGHEEEICGICVSKKKSGLKVSLWTRTADNSLSQLEIGAFMKRLFPGDSSPPVLKYLRHCETLEACSPQLTKGTSPTNSPTMRFPVSDLRSSSPMDVEGPPVKIPEALYSL